jgi:hypothetical protein
MTAQLIKSSWLSRTWEISTPDGKFTVQYSGLGFGNEKISVNGKVTVKKSSLLWFVPRFEFPLGQAPAILEIRVWPWLAIRSLLLNVNGEDCYREGSSSEL